MKYKVVCDCIIYIFYYTRVLTHSKVSNCVVSGLRWAWCGHSASMTSSSLTTSIPPYQLPFHRWTILTLRAGSHYTSRFLSVAERHRSVNFLSRVIKRRCSHWQGRLRQVWVPFRRRRRARMFDVMERVRTGLNLLDSDNVISNYVTSTTRRVCACNEGCLFVLRNGWKINRIGA
jgi:hypothetical protein